MAHFAKVKNGIVTNVIVAEQEFINNLVENEAGEYMETSYNGNFRKNYAGVGFTYDKERDAFIPPKPFPSYILKEDICHWEAPVAYPTDGKKYIWNEEITNWEETE